MSITQTSQTTLLDIAKANGSDPLVGLIEETIVATPEIQVMPARTIKGLSYKTFVRTALPTVGFRKANTGTVQSKSTYENRTVDCYIMNPRIAADKAVADGYEDGAAAWMAMEADGILRGSWITLASQLYYGALNDGSNGFPGLISAYDSVNMTINAGGSTANGCSSVWLVKFGPQYAQWVFGLNGQLQLSDVLVNPAATDANGNQYTAYVQEINARPGFQLGSLLGVACIKNIDATHPLTDTLLSKAMALFRIGIRPDAVLMSRNVRQGLQASRTVTLFGNSGMKVSGKEATLAPEPTEYDGVTIYPTDAITNTEQPR